MAVSLEKDSVDKKRTFFLYFFLFGLLDLLFEFLSVFFAEETDLLEEVVAPVDFE